MVFTPHGKHLIAGKVAGETTFLSSPSSGTHRTPFRQVIAAHVDAAALAAEEAFWTYGYLPRETRASFLMAIAAEIEARGEAITEIAMQETGLPAARLEGERGRTTGQLRLFAYLFQRASFWTGASMRRCLIASLCRAPKFALMQRPSGSVAVFGASNFPLAFSVAWAIQHRRLPPAARSW